jgi:chemotaxis protein CheD
MAERKGDSLVVGISDMAVSTKGETIVTYSLGSCLGLTAYDPESGVSGLIHCLLPLSKIDPEKARNKPYMFVDKGVTKFLGELLKKGAKKKNLVIKAAGCGAALNSSGSFNIGQRNFTVLRKILWKNNLLIAGKDIGGSKARTMFIFGDGETEIKSGAERYKV